EAGRTDAIIALHAAAEAGDRRRLPHADEVREVALPGAAAGADAVVPLHHASPAEHLRRRPDAGEIGEVADAIGPGRAEAVVALNAAAGTPDRYHRDATVAIDAEVFPGRTGHRHAGAAADANRTDGARRYRAVEAAELARSGHDRHASAGAVASPAIDAAAVALERRRPAEAAHVDSIDRTAAGAAIPDQAAGAGLRPPRDDLIRGQWGRGRGVLWARMNSHSMVAGAWSLGWPGGGALNGGASGFWSSPEGSSGATPTGPVISWSVR